MKMPIPHFRIIPYVRKQRAFNVVIYPTWHRCGLFTTFSLGVCAALIVIMCLSFTPLSEYTLSLTSYFHIRFWNGHIWFFNNAAYGPYRGSIISVSGVGGATTGPTAMEGIASSP